MGTRMFVDGDWCDAASGATVDSTSPATGESLGTVAWGDRADARRAIAGDKEDPEQAGKDWVEANRDKVDAWLQ
jgi:acyl-CoA reductase-like NAD-dependent aldehyde dehydrogenase